MKQFGAISTALMLLAVLIACPVLACGLMPNSDATHSCCPHSKSHSAPSSQTSAQDCPYLLLETGKNPTFTPYVPALLPTTLSFAVALWPSTVEPRTHAPDSSGLFLRLRVLRI